MSSTAESAGNSLLRVLPSVDEILLLERIRVIADSAGARKTTEFIREEVDAVRAELLAGKADPAAGETGREDLIDQIASRVEVRWLKENALRINAVINATGVVIHTNLGRSPLSEDALRAVADVAAGYCTLEYDLNTGKRGKRGIGAERLLCDLTGAEAALIVNNCAAAALLVLTALGKGGNVVVSRGELVEIGGDFRIPDVLARSGCTLKEVGTTNRTKIADYEMAIDAATTMIMRVHPSNYRVVGFTAAPTTDDLVMLACEKGIIFFEDAGSGAIGDLASIGLGDEPIIARSVEQGIDLIAFSGDKLLGGPQSGIVVGRRKLIEQVRSHPLYRALRADKLVYAALEATLRSYVRGTQQQDIPVLKMLSRTPEEIRQRANGLLSTISSEQTRSLSIAIEDGSSAIGGGAAPDIEPRTAVIAITSEKFSTMELERKLRMSDPPVIARIENDRIVIDLRTVFGEEESALRNAILSLAEGAD